VHKFVLKSEGKGPKRQTTINAFQTGSVRDKGHEIFRVIMLHFARFFSPLSCHSSMTHAFFWARFVFKCSEDRAASFHTS
jgi:hypothetical protein